MASNFVQRTVTGVLFVAVLVGSIFYSPLTFGLLFTLISALSVHEFARLINQQGQAHINPVITALGGAYLSLAMMSYCTQQSAGSAVFLPYLALILYLMIAELYLKHENPIANWGMTMLSQLYIALPFALLSVLAFHNNAEGSVSYNPILPLSIFVFIWLSDTGAYCFGSLFGKHRLFERISPKKSWEGSIGGGIVSIASAFAFGYFFPIMPMWQWAGLAATVVIFGTWGDLTESLMKRQLGIKDSGNILPGHGGMLDRFDSALMAIPAAVVYLYVTALF